MQLTAHQQDAINAAVAALADGGEFTLAGLAGTGKTTILKALVEALRQGGSFPFDTAFVAAPTNKAASVLKQKEVHPTPTTIHSLAFKFQGVRREFKCGCGFQDETTSHSRTIICPKCHATIQATPTKEDQLVFAKKDFDSAIVLVDEASMVGDNLASHLRSKCPAILWCGDHGQLPPVKAEDAGIFDDIGFELTEIHRQAKDNPIIQFAYALRNGLPLGADFDGILRTQKSNATFVASHKQIDMFITHTNKDRVAINRAVRLRDGRTSDQPGEGDMICLLGNDHRYGLYNGDICKVVESSDAGECWSVKVEHPMNGFQFNFACPKEQFNRDTRMKIDDVEELKFEHSNVMPADFGYAITGHKSQGSQWKNVGVVAPRFQIRDANRWNYTVATRAAENLVIFGG